MGDTYQAVYDAARSRMSNGDIGDAVASAVRDANLSHYVEQAMHAIVEAACDTDRECRRPSVLYKPTLSACLGMWVASYGQLHGTGSSPAAAMLDFDRAFGVNAEQPGDHDAVVNHHPFVKGDSCQPK